MASPSNCPIREHTGDGAYVGRCDFYIRNDACPRHGYLIDYPTLDDREVDPQDRRFPNTNLTGNTVKVKSIIKVPWRLRWDMWRQKRRNRKLVSPDLSAELRRREDEAFLFGTSQPRSLIDPDSHNSTSNSCSRFGRSSQSSPQ